MSDNINIYSKEQVDAKLTDKQDALTAGDNITIADGVISAEVPDDKVFEAGNYTGSTANGQQVVINYGEADEQDLVTSKYYKATGQNTDGAMTQKAVTDELALKADSADLATVATSGDYDDLMNRPIIPAGAVLYDSTGQNTDGAMTQKATTDAIAGGGGMTAHTYNTFADLATDMLANPNGILRLTASTQSTAPIIDFYISGSTIQIVTASITIMTNSATIRKTTFPISRAETGTSQSGTSYYLIYTTSWTKGTDTDYLYVSRLIYYY